MNPPTNDDQNMSYAQPQSGAAATMPMPSMASTVPPQPAAAPQGLPVPDAEPPMLAAPVAPPLAPPLASGAAPAVLQPTVPVHPVQPAAGSNGAGGGAAQSATALDAPAEAADNDVIEKEWVVKAKEIVAATAEDPYKQVQEINKLKADYMKKRYDKDIKLADE